MSTYKISSWDFPFYSPIKRGDLLWKQDNESLGIKPMLAGLPGLWVNIIVWNFLHSLWEHLRSKQYHFLAQFKLNTIVSHLFSFSACRLEKTHKNNFQITIDVVYNFRKTGRVEAQQMVKHGADKCVYSRNKQEL